MGTLIKFDDYNPINIEQKANNILNFLDLQNKEVAPISKICDEYNIAIDYRNFDGNDILGMLSVDDIYLKKYETNKVIFLNKKIPVEMSRYTIAYLLGNYMYVYEEVYKNAKKYKYVKYNADMNFSIFDRACNLFALYLTMPEDKFMEKFEQFECEFSDANTILTELANHFLVPYEKLEERSSLLFDKMPNKGEKIIKLKI